MSVALGIHHAMRMRSIFISGRSGSAVFSPHYLKKRHDSPPPPAPHTQKSYGTQNVCSDFHYKMFSGTFPIVTITERDMIKMYTDIHVKNSLFSSDFKETRTFSTYFFEK
jgi:hypothetical protein